MTKVKVITENDIKNKAKNSKKSLGGWLKFIGNGIIGVGKASIIASIAYTGYNYVFLTNSDTVDKIAAIPMAAFALWMLITALTNKQGEK